jgi:hypothetical protein
VKRNRQRRTRRTRKKTKRRTRKSNLLSKIVNIKNPPSLLKAGFLCLGSSFTGKGQFPFSGVLLSSGVDNGVTDLFRKSPKAQSFRLSPDVLTRGGDIQEMVMVQLKCCVAEEGLAL